MNEINQNNNLSNFILYNTPNGEVAISVLLQDETIWLTQDQMSTLFERERSVITKHISKVFKEGELDEKSNVQILHISGSDKPVRFYNLNVIISVGYRVKSHKGTQFRIWATKTLNEFIKKGFVLDDNRLKQGEQTFGKDYFRELLERIRSIRASERRIYQQITDIFAECSIDYNPKSELSKEFYSMIQNKFHYAITGKTAAEIIHQKANAKSHNMGLSTWKNSPDGRILISDTQIAKNYLSEKEIKQLERTITGYFDYIENLIERENTFTMEELAKSVDKFLNFNEYKILEGKGKISHQKAIKKASNEYDEFNKTQKIISDFDKKIKSLKK
jgi:hypothetical protein